ncbi:hypothetical protein LOTGIDRAFT_238184 [Lottia gigantea]|uniref:Major facilitator superfamily (MFS) profile domain-containing protein n=1 Tax=Lottia gigantea TaxID=225164 RepID=V4B246_LOTGI|nr:hypothetical protein LOTGIDRAFT_238184 [Lottia gigantea]ESP01706.1 hypothetical protein LOTGIDRAFT_238184 [Lottia gigantea]
MADMSVISKTAYYWVGLSHSLRSDCRSFHSLMSKTEPWSWVVLVAAFLAMFSNGSLYLSTGVLHLALMERYSEEGENKVAWLGSLFTSMTGLTGLLGSLLINTFNVRICIICSAFLNLIGFAVSGVVTDINILFITYSFIAGIGQALCYTASMVVTGYHFKEKSSMATGIVTSSSGLSLFVFPPLTQLLVDTYGLNGAFLILGAIGFHAAACGAVMRPSEYENKSFQCGKQSYRSSQMLNSTYKETTKVSAMYHMKSVRFWIFLFSSACFCMALSTVYLYLPMFNSYHGTSKRNSALILSVAGITGTISRVLLGFLASSVDVTIVFSGVFGIIGTITVLLFTMTNFSAQIGYSALLGIYSGGCWSLQHTLLIDIVGITHLSTCYGITLLFSGIGLLIGPPLAELIITHFNNLDYAFIFAGCLFLLASFSGLILGFLKKFQKGILPGDELTKKETELIVMNGEFHEAGEETTNML